MEGTKLEKREDGIYAVGESTWGPVERKLDDAQVANGKREFEQKVANLNNLNGQRESLEEQLDALDQKIEEAQASVDEFGDVFVEEEVVEEESTDEESSEPSPPEDEPTAQPPVQ